MRKTSDDLLPMLPMMGQPDHAFTMIKNDNHNRIELHIRGGIPDPSAVSGEFSLLYQYAEEYPTLLIYLNSPGGVVSTAVELLSIMGKYRTVITVATGEIASAGFFIWCAGQIRVIQPYCSVMTHRESYGGTAKTQQHIDQAVYVNELYDELIEDVCGGVLTKEEVERIKYTEVFFSGKELINRDQAISWEQFVEADTTPIEWGTYATINDKQYVRVSEDLVMMESEEGPSYIISLYDAIYNTPNPAILGIEETESEETENEIETAELYLPHSSLI